MTADVRTKPQVATMNAVHDLPVLVARDLGFYAMVGGIPRPAWPGHPSSGSA